MMKLFPHMERWWKEKKHPWDGLFSPGSNRSKHLDLTKTFRVYDYFSVSVCVPPGFRKRKTFGAQIGTWIQIGIGPRSGRNRNLIVYTRLCSKRFGKLELAGTLPVTFFLDDLATFTVLSSSYFCNCDATSFSIAIDGGRATSDKYLSCPVIFLSDNICSDTLHNASRACSWMPGCQRMMEEECNSGVWSRAGTTTWYLDTRQEGLFLIPESFLARSFWRLTSMRCLTRTISQMQFEALCT